MSFALPAGPQAFYTVCTPRTGGAPIVKRRSITGALLASDTIAIGPYRREPWYFVDPLDTTVAIVAASDSGIVFARLNGDRPSRGAWTTIITHHGVRQPSALFQGDSLYLVWTELRGRESDIYGVAIARAEIPVPKPPDAPDGGATMRLSITSTPIPTTSIATFRVVLAQAGSLVLTIFDARGRALQTERREVLQAGGHDIVIDVSGYDDGIYLARATSGPAAAFTRLPIVHDE